MLFRSKDALAAYEKSAAANPGGSECHYRLGLTYKRLGEEAKAQSEIAEYKELEKAEAAVVERQRRELRQFLVVLKDRPVKDQSSKDQSWKDQPVTEQPR